MARGDVIYDDHQILPENEMGISLEIIPQEIMDSPAPWFRRPNLINRKVNANNYYRVGILDDSSAGLNEELSSKFEDGPFAKFLNWSPGQNSRKLLNAVMSRAVFKEQGIWFHIRGQDVEYTLQDHALITGLRFGPTEFDPRIARDPHCSSLFRSVCGRLNQSATWLNSTFNNSPDLDGDVRVKLANLLMANCFILGHDAQNAVYPWLWELVDDTDAFNSFPYGAYSYKTLLYYVRTFRRTGDKYHIYGPAWSLIMWACEVMDGLGDSFARRESIDELPRCLRWKFLQNFRGVSDAELYEQFDDDELQILMILPEGGEIVQDYFLSVHQVEALLVKFHVPTSQYIPRPQPRRAVPDPQHPVEDLPSGSRQRRSTRQTRFVGDLSEEGTSSTRSTRESRVTGHVSGSSRRWGNEEGVPSGISREDHLAIVQEAVQRESAKLLEQYKEELRASEKSILATVKQWIGNKAKKLVTCGTSTMPSPVHIPRPQVCSPLNISSRRESVSGVEMGHEVNEPVEGVGQRTDTALPIYTASYSEPYTGQETPFTAPASSNEMPPPFSSIFQQALLPYTPLSVPTSSGIAWSDVPSFGQAYVPGYPNMPELPRYSMPEFSSLGPDFSTPVPTASTGIHPNITTRDQPRRASSAEHSQSSMSGAQNTGRPSTSGAVSTYLPPAGPTWPPASVRARFDEFLDPKNKRRPVQIKEAVALMSQLDFLEIMNKDADWDTVTIDLALMTLRQILKGGVGVKEEFRGGGAIICNLHVMIELKADYMRLRQQAYDLWSAPSERRGPHFAQLVRDYIKDKWRPSPLLTDLMKGEGVPIDTPPWWNAHVVFIPWLVQNNSRCLPVMVSFVDKRIIVFDPYYWGLDENERKNIRMEFAPLHSLLPTLVAGGGYWICNAHNLRKAVDKFQLCFYELDGQVYSYRPHSHGPIALMNIERHLTGWPGSGNVDQNLDVYRELVACRIYSYRV